VAFGSGEAMILAATLMWAVEIVYVKRLMESFDPQVLATARMALGAVLLIIWVLITGKGHALLSLSGLQWRWVLLTGVLLTGYVGTWYAALARAQAIDVTAVLVFGAVITAVLAGTAGSASINAPALLLVAAGSATITWAALRAPASGYARSS
jgi:drug/metabolite transporter (DMT)-like permease